MAGRRPHPGWPARPQRLPVGPMVKMSCGVAFVSCCRMSGQVYYEDEQVQVSTGMPVVPLPESGR